MDTEELKRAWAAVPDRAIVMCRKTSWRGDNAPWFGYRYRRMGRWIYYHDAWDPGKMYWSWDLTNGNTEGLSDFVVIARDVSPHTEIAEAAALCVAPVGSFPTRTIVRFERGSRILWDDVAPGMLVMIDGGTVAYKFADGMGRWIRTGFLEWTDNSWRTAFGWDKVNLASKVCGVIASGVGEDGYRDCVDAFYTRLQDTVSGLDARVELETRCRPI